MSKKKLSPTLRKKAFKSKIRAKLPAKEAPSQPVIQSGLKKDLARALKHWDEISVQVSQEIPPDQKQLTEFKQLLKEVSRKIKAFEA